MVPPRVVSRSHGPPGPAKGRASVGASGLTRRHDRPRRRACQTQLALELTARPSGEPIRPQAGTSFRGRSADRRKANSMRLLKALTLVAGCALVLAVVAAAAGSGSTAVVKVDK